MIVSIQWNLWKRSCFLAINVEKKIVAINSCDFVNIWKAQFCSEPSNFNVILNHLNISQFKRNLKEILVMYKDFLRRFHLLDSVKRREFLVSIKFSRVYCCIKRKPCRIMSYQYQNTYSKDSDSYPLLITMTWTQTISTNS